MTARVLKLGVAISAAGAALMLGAGSASAATTFTVSAGSAANGTTVAITGRTLGAAPRITFTDTTTQTGLTCDAGTAPGTTKTGTSVAGAGIGTINGPGTKWTNCTGPLGLVFTVVGVGNWSINATNGTAAAVNGTITNITANVTSNAGCNFTVTGSVPIRYTNSNQVLQVLTTASNLKLTNVTASACFGLVNEGDSANFSAKYKLTAVKAANNPVQIVKNS